MPKIYVFYHFLHPDDVISAVLFSELASQLSAKGWQVSAFPSNRCHSGGDTAYPPRETWHNVSIRRLWRPAWSQSRGSRRVLNSLWMIARWSLLALLPGHRPDVLIIGSDPMLCLLVAPVWRRLKPRTRIVHWCFDVYPEAAYADGILDGKGTLPELLFSMMRKAYRACDLLIDIGPGMRRLLDTYAPTCRRLTLVPWAQAEPAEVVPTAGDERSGVFGETRLALMYSGSFGRAHSFEDMLELVRILRPDGVDLALSLRGHREAELRAAIVPEDTNIHFLDFAPAGELELRLAAADIHVVSLRPEWTATVVPSKFFGAMAIGRPVLFCGSRDSDIALWIEQYGLGWVLTPGDAPAVARQMRAVLDDPDALRRLRERCFQTYCEHFSRQHSIDIWDAQLKSLVSGD